MKTVAIILLISFTCTLLEELFNDIKESEELYKTRIAREKYLERQRDIKNKEE